MPARNPSFEPIADTLKKTVAILRNDQIPFLLGGSLACWARGGPESSNDLDVMVKTQDAERALEALGKAGMRTERPHEEWLFKAYDEDVLIDIVFEPVGMEITDEVLARGDEIDVIGIAIPVMALEDVLTTKLLSLKEHYLDYEALLQISRSLREQIDWAEVRRRTDHSPYAKAFFTLVEELGIVDREQVEGDESGRLVDLSAAQSRR